MQSRSKRNEMIKDGAYDGRYKEKVVKSKKKVPRKTEKLSVSLQIEEELYNQQSSDVIGHIELDYYEEEEN